MVMVIDNPSMRARRVCSICLGGGYLAFVLGFAVSCRDGGGAAPAVGRAAAGAASSATAKVPEASAPRLSAEGPELLVPSCSPCRFLTAPGVEYEIRFQAPANGAEIRDIQIKPADPAAPKSAGHATLTIDDGFSPTGNFMLQALDLNFDGVLDLGFGPVLGTPNLSLSYWVNDAGGSGWRKLGMLSNVKLEPAAREVVTREKGGHAGMLWQEKVFRWQGGELVLVRSVEQEEDLGKRGYRKVTRTFEGGKQTSEKAEAVSAPSGSE